MSEIKVLDLLECQIHCLIMQIIGSVNGSDAELKTDCVKNIS